MQLSFHEKRLDAKKRSNFATMTTAAAAAAAAAATASQQTTKDSAITHAILEARES